MTQTAMILPKKDVLALAGKAANGYAAQSVFEDYRSRKAEQTRRRQDNDLALFSRFLQEAHIHVGGFAEDPKAWRGITWGLVDGFCRWQLQKGYAVSSVNIRLATVKMYARLAMRAEMIPPNEYSMIATIKGYSRKEIKRKDDERRAHGLNTRMGTKKAEAVSITPEQASMLMQQPTTAQGRRDALLLCLLLEHGLRVGEVAHLQVVDFNLKAGTLNFDRPKVGKNQTHALTPRTLVALRSYLKSDAPKEGSIWRKSASKREGRNKAHKLTEQQGMSERGISKRVSILGRRIGLERLSAHDCRHFWATQAARNGTPIDRLQDAGGWSSPAMPLRYVEAARIANQGVKLR